MQQLHKNINANNDVEAILANNVDFYDFNAVLSKYYESPKSGSVKRTHICSMNTSKLATMELRDTVYSKVRVQNLRSGDWLDA